MLINSNGDKINTGDYTYFNRGNNAIIKVKDDEILKLYNVYVEILYQNLCLNY